MPSPARQARLRYWSVQYQMGCLRLGYYRRLLLLLANHRCCLHRVTGPSTQNLNNFGRVHPDGMGSVGKVALDNQFRNCLLVQPCHCFSHGEAIFNTQTECWPLVSCPKILLLKRLWKFNTLFTHDLENDKHQ